MFAASSETFVECVAHDLFGAPSNTWGLVKNITVGDTALFLYNVSTATLHGVYVATKPPKYNTTSSAWASQRKHKSSECPYPCQVQVRQTSVLHPLPQDVYSKILAEHLHVAATPSSRTIHHRTKMHSMELTSDEVAAIISRGHG